MEYKKIPAKFIYFFGVLRLPESPRFLVRTGKVDEARHVLSMIRPAESVEDELRQINETAEEEAKASASASWSTVFSGKYRYLVVAGVGVAAFQQFQGANAIFYYIPLIVEEASGIPASNALMWPIIQGIILVLGSLLFMLIADKFNRRSLLTLGGSIMGISFLLPAVINWINPGTNPMLIVVSPASMSPSIRSHGCR